MKQGSAKKTQDSYTELFCGQNGMTVPIRVDTEQSFFDRRDALGVTLSPALCEYLDGCLSNLPRAKKITLVFYCPSLTSTQKEVVRNLVKTHYGLRLAYGEKALLQAAVQAVVEIVFAAVLCVCLFFASEMALRVACAVGAVILLLAAGKVFNSAIRPLLKTNSFLRRMYICAIEFKPAIPEK